MVGIPREGDLMRIQAKLAAAGVEMASVSWVA
jgi:hypothetical protein